MTKTIAAPALCRMCRILCRTVCRINGQKTFINQRCAGCAGFIVYFPVRACAHARPRRHPTQKNAFSRVYAPRHIRHIRHIVDLYNYFLNKLIASPAQHPAHPAQTSFFTQKTKKMAKTTIYTTPENAKEMAATVKSWPQLLTLVKDLQAQDLFPGLRGLQITLTGPQNFVNGGLASVRQINAQNDQNAALPQKDTAP